MAILLERDTSFEESAYLYYNVATSLNLIISKIEEDRGVSSELERFLEDTDWFLDRASDKVNSLTGYIKSQYPAYVLPPRLSESVNYHTGCVFGICKDMVTFLSEDVGLEFPNSWINLDGTINCNGIIYCDQPIPC